MAVTTDPSKMLSDILRSGVVVDKVTKESQVEVIVKSKLSNSFLRGYVERLRKLGKYSEKQLLDFIVNLDEKVEQGKVTQKYFDEVKGKNN